MAAGDDQHFWYKSTITALQSYCWEIVPLLLSSESKFWELIPLCRVSSIQMDPGHSCTCLSLLLVGTGYRGLRKSSNDDHWPFIITVSHELHSLVLLAAFILALVSAFYELVDKVASTWSNLVPWEHNVVTSPARQPSGEESTPHMISILLVPVQKYTSPPRKAYMGKLSVKSHILWKAFLVHNVSHGWTWSHGSLMFPQTVHLLCVHQYGKYNTQRIHFFRDQIWISIGNSTVKNWKTKHQLKDPTYFLNLSVLIHFERGCLLEVLLLFMGREREIGF